MKFKKIPLDYFINILDKLTRFEPANVRYKRVFDDIINKFYLESDIKNLNSIDKINIALDIINKSLNSPKCDCYLNDVLKDLEDKYFYSNEECYQYLSIRLPYSDILDNIQLNDKTSKNVLWLKKINDERKNIFQLRKEYDLIYPIEKIILCEGQTEFTLLETIFSLYDISFKKLGYYVIPAGGKNQVARKYYDMIEYTKIPFYILLDLDAIPIKELIDTKLRKEDRIYIIKNGEFEDIIPTEILKNTLNAIHKNEFNCSLSDFKEDYSTVENLENICKKYGFGEFKKAKFSLQLKEYILKNTSKEDFKTSETELLVNDFNLYNQKQGLT